MFQRILLLLAVIVVLAAAGVFAWFHFWRSSVAENFAPGALDHYLPPDAAAVITIDLKQLRDQGVLDKPVGKALQQILAKEEVGLPLDLLKIDPATDIDLVRLVFAPGGLSQPLVLLRGRFDREKFHTGPEQLEEVKQDNFRLYRFQKADRDLTLAPAGDTLVVSLARSRVLAALRHAAGQSAPSLEDTRFKELLEKVDQNQALWLAADMEKLGRPPYAVALLEPWLRPIYDWTATAYGSAVCGPKDLKAEVVLEGKSEEDARKLETHLNTTIKTIRGLGRFIPGDSNIVTLVRSFAESEVERQGKTVRMCSHLAVE